MRKGILLSILAVAVGFTTACTDSTAPESAVPATWVEESPGLYMYGNTGANVLWAFFDTELTDKPVVSAKVIGGSSIKVIKILSEPVGYVSSTRMRHRADFVFQVVQPGITCVELRIARGPTTERCLGVNLNGKGNLQVSLQ